MVVALGLFLAHHGESPIAVHEVLRHEHDQDGLHPVEAEAFGRFVADDLRDARRPALYIQWICAVLGHGPFSCAVRGMSVERFPVWGQIRTSMPHLATGCTFSLPPSRGAEAFS